MDGTTIKTTNCVGDTSYRPSAKIQKKGTIIGMAEKALYIAKQSGRNKVYAMKLPGS